MAWRALEKTVVGTSITREALNDWLSRNPGDTHRIASAFGGEVGSAFDVVGQMLRAEVVRIRTERGL